MLNIRTIESKFKRSKITSSKTFLWKDAPASIKESISQSLALPQNETIILIFHDLERARFAITDQSVITMQEKIAFSNIQNIDFTEIKKEPHKKITSTKLDIITKDQSKHLLEVEDGTWHVIYNILRLAITAATRIA